MNPRRKVGRLQVGFAALVGFAVLAPLAYSNEQEPVSAKRAGTTQGSDWTLRVDPDVSFKILHKGVPVVKASHVFWGPKGWSWTQSEFKLETRAGGRSFVVGEVPNLKLKMIGEVQSPTPNRLLIDFEIEASERFRPVIGGGWEWSLLMDSPALGGGLPDPVLLPDHAGWSWPTGPGQAVGVRFEPSAPLVYFEKGQKSTIRTFLVANSIEAGRSRVRMTIELPEGGRRVPNASERYAPVDRSRWFRNALAWDVAPVDLSFLNRDDRPAGRHGFVKPDGDRFVRGDGTPVRFWGGNIVGAAVFSTPREYVPSQAHRMAQLGFNLMRVHHHDSPWVNPYVFDRRYNDTRHVDAGALDSLDWWIKCLKDEGIYVWLDLNVLRTFKPGDGIAQGFDEILRNRGTAYGLCYYNERVQELMKEFQQQYLNHMNPYTKLRYKDDPAVMGVLITNENDLTHHSGLLMLPDKNNPVHNALWTRGYKAFAARYALPPGRVFQSWLPGPNKLYLNDAEHDFNKAMIGDLRAMGVKASIATTNYWGAASLFSIPALTDGDVIDVHSYGSSEAMEINPRYKGNYVAWIATAQVYGKPLSITEWNVNFPEIDRFTSPLYLASIASLQGWDAPMVFAYSQAPFTPNKSAPEQWSTFDDPAMAGVMPAAALAYRQGHVSPARTTYCLMLDPRQLFDRALNPDTAATIRTLTEQSKFTIGVPQVKELPWLEPTKPGKDATILTDPDHDFIPEGQSYVRSDTGELTRDWVQGIHTIDAPKTQAVMGWIGDKTMKTRDATFETSTRKAVIALSSVDNRPLNTSRFIMITAVARVVATPGSRLPFVSEPVLARISLRTQTAGFQLLALGPDGQVVGRSTPKRNGDLLTFNLPTGGGTHWYVLKSSESTNSTSATSTGTIRRTD